MVAARVERKRNPGRHRDRERAVPDFAEFIIGPAEGRTRWLNPGYGCCRWPGAPCRSEGDGHEVG
jgi:hypothetical protein